MERILCALLIALLLCLSFACQSDDDDYDAPADDDDDDDNDDDNDDDDDDDMDDDSDDDTDDLDGAHPIVATSFGNFLVFFDLFDATAALPKLSAETEFGFVEQLIGGMSGNRFVGLAMAPAESIGQLTAQSLFNVYEAALAADANGVLHLATITRNPNRLHYYTLQDGMPSEEQTWDYSSLIGFNSLSLIFDADDQAHLFFITGLPPDYTLQHIYRDNDGWQSENAFAGYVIRYQAVGDAQNTLHVALGTEQAILYGTNGSGAWQFQTVLDDYITPGIPTDLSHPQIALNGDGRPMIAALYYGHTQGYLPKVITHVWFAEQFDAGTPLAKVWENNQYDYRQLTMGTDAAGAPHLVLTGEFDRHLWFADGVWNDKYLSFPSDNHLLLVGDERDRLHLLGYGPLEYSDEKSVLYKRYREGEWNDTSRVGPDGLEMRSLLVATATDGRRNIFALGHDPYFVSGEPGDWAVEPLASLIPYGLYHNLLLDSADDPHVVCSSLMTIVQIARQNGGDWQWELLYDPADGDDRSIDDDVADDDDDDDDTVVDPIGSLAAVETSADDLRLVYWNVVTEHLDLLTPGAGGYDVETLTSFSGQPHKMQLLIDEADRNHLVLRRYNNVDYLTDQSGIWTEYSLFADPNYYTNPDNHFTALFDDGGDLHIAFYDVEAEALAYLHGQPGAWDLSYPEGGEECYGPKIAFDGDGELHLLCQTRSFLLHLQGAPGDWTAEEIPLVSDDLLLFDFTVEDNGLLTLFFIDDDALTVISN